MRIHNIYADENGETHFRDIDIEMRALFSLSRRIENALEHNIDRVALFVA